MSRRRESRPATALELKSLRLTGIQVIVNSSDRAALANHIDTLFSDAHDFFGGEAAVFDCVRLEADAAPPDWTWLCGELKRRGLHPFAVRNASVAVADAARDAGLAVLDADAPARPQPRTEPAPETAAPAEAETAPAEAPRQPELDLAARTEPAAPEPAAAKPATEPAAPPPAAVPTRIVDKPLRSGQRVYAQGGDLVVLAMVNPGAEVIADGSIHVYAPLRGRALAGARGDTSARIFTSAFEAELVSIAGVYRTFETAPDSKVHKRPTQVRLTDSSQLEVVPL